MAASGTSMMASATKPGREIAEDSRDRGQGSLVTGQEHMPCPSGRELDPGALTSRGIRADDERRIPDPDTARPAGGGPLRSVRMQHEVDVYLRGNRGESSLTHGVAAQFAALGFGQAQPCLPP